MARHGWTLLAVLAALAVASPAPVANVSDVAEPFPLHPPSSDLPLAEQAAREGFTLPPRKVRAKAAVDDTARGAQAFPFGMADPHPPQHFRQRKLDARARTKRAADDIYDETKLPTNVVPTRYTVTMAPNLATGIFYGATDIYINAVEATSRIILHGAPDITFTTVQILRQQAAGDFVNNGNATFVPLSLHEDLERLVIDLETELVAGEHYLLRFPLFGAYLRQDLKGFYLSSYENDDREKVMLATTQFEPPAARFAFPCFDEPALKARFKIIVEHDRELMAKSNMPEKSITQPTLTTVRTEFEDTLPMSTYLLAWIVSDFKGLASTASTTKPFTTWGRSNLIRDDTAYLANMVMPKALELLGDFNGIPYELPKMDQFAIPDFDEGAMENWGIVTYREEYLLETSDTTIRIREFIATTVCHELGHQWTGDLVTLDWWSNTWLNEGFATYFENVICDKIFPDWHLMDMYVTDNVHVGIANDVLPGQIAMSSPAFSTAAISGKFDRISYKKGGSVLRMFEHILGTDVFKKAMNRYLTDNHYNSGTPDRLFRAMHAEAVAASVLLPPNTDFATMAKTWTEQAGVPVVTVTRNTAQGAVNITQEQFFYETPEDQEATRWYVPIPAIVDPNTKDWTKTAPVRWLTPETPSIVASDVDASASEWIVVNPKQIGYYLVNYDADNWKLLQQALLSTPGELHAATRAQLVHDALAMARAGRLDYATALPFLQALKDERSPAVWKAGVEALAFLRDRLAVTEAGSALRAFIQQITADAYDAVGFGPSATTSPADTSKDEERYLRFFVASYACYAGHKQCVDDAVKAVQTLIENDVRPNADVRDAALCYAVQNSVAAFNSAIERFMETWESKERAEYAAALSCTMNHPLLEALMDGIIAKEQGTDLNAADLQQLINAILSRWDNHRFMLNYYKKNWRKIFSFTGNSFYVNVLNALIGDIRTEEELREVTAFVAEAFPQTTSTVRREFDLRLDAAGKGLSWNRQHFTEVSEWLYKATGTGPVIPTEPTAAPTKPTSAPTKPTSAPTKPPTTAPTRSPTNPTTAATPATTPKNAASQVGGVATLVAAALLALLLR